MSDLSRLSGVERKLAFGVDPERTLVLPHGSVLCFDQFS
jgi:hypothetical protein